MGTKERLKESPLGQVENSLSP